MTANHTQFEGLLIDMDGTLVDHVDTLTRCYQFVTSQLGFPSPSTETVQRSIGGSMPFTIGKFLPEDKVTEGMALWRKHFDDIHLEGVRVLPGARDLLRFAKKQNMQAAVFTNKIGDHTRAIVENEGLAPFLSFCLGAEDTPFRKPDKEFSQIAIDRLQAPPEKVALIGDSPFDIQAAKSVGMISLCVTTGSHNASELADSGADHVFPDLLAVLDWLRQAPA